MSRLAKVFLGIVVIFVIVIGAATIAAQIYLAPFVKQQIEEKGSTALGAPVKVGSLTIGLFPPLTATASDIEFSAPEQGVKGRVRQLSLRARVGLSFDIKRAISDLKVRIVEPKLYYVLSAKPLEKKSTDSSSSDQEKSQNAFGQGLIADVEIENGHIEISESQKTKYLIEDLNFSTRYTGLGSLAKVRAQFKASAPEFLKSAKLPIVLASEFLFDGTNFSTDSTTADIAQIRASISGKQNLELGNGEWTIKASARDFAANSTTADLSLKGAITGEFSASIKLLKNSPSLSSLNLAVDLSNLQLAYKNLFNKPASTPLIIDARGNTEGEYFKLESAKVIFDRLQTSISASIPLPTSQQKNSNVTFSFTRTSLTGWEKFFPSLSQAPATGFIEGAGSFSGQIQDTNSYRITIKPLKLENINAHLDWKSEDKTKSVRGPIAVNGSIDLAASGSSLESAKADLVADLTKIQIEVKDTFSKPAGTVFRTELHAAQKNLREIELSKTAVQLGSNQLVFSGTVQEPQKPRLKLNISAPKLSITELSKMLLAMKKYNLTGSAKGDFKLTGTYNFADGIEKSPLSIAGNVIADIPSLKCPASKPLGEPSPTANYRSSPEPMLPAWPIAQTAVVTSKVSVKTLNCKDLAMSGVAWNGKLNQGVLTGSVIIQKIFDGRLNVKSLKTNLAQAQPDTEAVVNFEGLDINQAITWLSPTWKNLVKGRLHGTSQVFAPDSSRSDFLDKTRAQGSIQIKNAFVSTLQIDQMINQAIAKIPGLGKKEAVNSKGIAATIDSDYSFANSVMNLKKFNFLSPDKNEITASGTIDLAQNAKISGTAYLATAPVGGSVKAANSDSQGRLVVPFELNGNLMNPSVSFAEKTIQKLAENTAKKELDNLKVRAQEQGKKELEKKFEELKNKGLKGLFGK